MPGLIEDCGGCVHQTVGEDGVALEPSGDDTEALPARTRISMSAHCAHTNSKSARQIIQNTQAQYVDLESRGNTPDLGLIELIERGLCGSTRPVQHTAALFWINNARHLMRTNACTAALL